MILYVLLALIFSFCIILSALVLVKNSEMSRELWSLRVELLNVSSLVQQCQDQQDNHWKAVQTGIREAKSNIATVSSKVQSGNDKLKTVLADITDIKKTLQELEKKVLTQCLSLLYREKHSRLHFASEILFWNLALPNAGFLICCGDSLLQALVSSPKG
ncbi:mast cell-expressed membrane protein 1 [Microtus pennsylvanicus]|uniref:mast cell-expressed membrane protein 1 n=1 Tax=Microtus pennsylvanicus TaxID=10058 RepID=UPI003F6BD68A